MTGLIVDWGGVLTNDTASVVAAWADADGVDLDAYSAIITDWLGEPFGRGPSSTRSTRSSAGS